jgi:short-subunit dehydrogenase
MSETMDKQIDRVAVITGASRGIGRQLALRLAGRGMRLGLIARNAERLETLRQEILAVGADAKIFALDVTDSTGVSAAVQATEQAFGPVDLLVANAGVSQSFGVKNYDVKLATKVLDTNVKGTINAVAAVLPSMRTRNRGHIVGISSLASYQPLAGHGAYSSSKVAMNYLLSALRMELLRTGIAVTTICPGYIRTDMTAQQRFKMPFLMDVDPAVDHIMRAIDGKKTVYNFPWPMALLVRTVGLLPLTWYERLGRLFRR